MIDRRLETSSPGVANLSDEVLVDRALADPYGFEALFNRYWDAIYRYCLYRLDQVEDAEDAASRIFLKTLAELPRFNTRLGTFRTWLFAIAHNEVANWHRRRARYRVDRLDLAEGIADPAPLPEDLAIHSTQIAEARRFLAALPDHYRRVIELRLAGLRDNEIAVVLGTTHGAIRKAQSRAIQHLRIEMGVAASGQEATDE